MSEAFRALARMGHGNSFAWLYYVKKDPFLPWRDRQWNEWCMDKRLWLMVQTTLKGLVLTLALSLYLGACPRSFARNDDPGSLNQQVLKLYQQGKYQDRHHPR